MKPGGPLERRTALVSGQTLTRKAPMQRRRQDTGTPAAARRSPAPRGFTDATRRLIYARDQRRCVRCGVNIASCPWSGSVQHRRSRGSGGSTVAWLQRPANGILLCGSGTTGCHGWAESYPIDAQRYGWRVERGIMTASAWPVFYPVTGQVRLLDDHGTHQVLAVLAAAGPLADASFTVGVFVSPG